ncbi:phosphoglycolate phosphatase [Anaerovirgula multivorans]|uniref:Phosphoglycolate phosphatase n=1 Tax=Anaerovirgula multivorans TaxID=312168 RepID=A0A239GU44_9FIRM|nr:HAD-IA family hydrolase [Anaerovirgula multivorans]SNS72308.1 phosphoglycolate phosphatase [Anaerovirgula multivorans]
MIKYFVFDFDGTLVDSQDIIIEAYNQLASKYKSNKIDQKDFEYIKGLSIVKRCKFLNFKLYKFPLMALDIYKLYKNSIKDLTLFDGIKELLEALNSKGFQLAIISTNSESNIRDFLQLNQIDFINEVICSNKIYGKDKDIKRFLETKKLKDFEVVYVGDEVRDIIASKKNGIEVIWVSWGYDQIDNIKKEHPDYIVNEPHEILSISSQFRGV